MDAAGGVAFAPARAASQKVNIERQPRFPEQAYGPVPPPGTKAVFDSVGASRVLAHYAGTLQLPYPFPKPKRRRVA